MYIKKVLIPSNFSDVSNKAIEVALPMIAQLGADIVFVHILERIDHPDPLSKLFDKGYAYLTNRAQTLLNDLVMLAKGRGMRADSELLEGAPYIEVLKFADKIGADLIIMATHGRRGFNRLILGSQAEKIVRMATGPVTTIRVSETAS